MWNPLRLGPLGVACVIWMLGGALAIAGEGAGCGTCAAAYSNCSSCKHPCPPHFKWWAEGPPKICFKCSCPRPVCDPCSLEHFGYYATCWAPWPFPPDWSHCPTPPPGAVLPPPPYPPYTPRTPQDPRRPDPRDRDGDLPTPSPKRDDQTPAAHLRSHTPANVIHQPRQPKAPTIRVTAITAAAATEEQAPVHVDEPPPPVRLITGAAKETSPAEVVPATTTSSPGVRLLPQSR